MKRVALIGATGFLGINTARELLKQGYELIAVYRSETGLQRIRDLAHKSVQADVDDRTSLVKAFRDADAVINCAGYTPHLPASWKKDARHASLQMENFCSACMDAGCRKIVFAGAASTLAKNPSGGPSNESFTYDQRPADRNNFLQSKWAMDKVASNYADRGLPIVTGIPTMALGEYDYRPTAGRLVLEIANGTMRGYVKAKRNVLYSGDTARGLVRCLKAGKPGERYLLSGQNVTMEYLVKTIARTAGVKPPRPVPIPLVLAVAKIQSIRYRLGGPVPTIMPATIKILTGGQYFDGKKAGDELDFRPEVSIETAIEKALNWFRKIGYLTNGK